MRATLFIAAALLAALVISRGAPDVKEKSVGPLMVYDAKSGDLVETERVALSEAEWKAKLSPESYRVLRSHGTERPFTCGLLEDKGEGIYTCGGCGLALFSSEHKFDSGTGWPSFYQPVHPANIGTTTDHLIGYPRTEVHCIRCDGHLGHVFEDGPRPTGLRYCINGASLSFAPAEKADK